MAAFKINIEVLIDFPEGGCTRVSKTLMSDYVPTPGMYFIDVALTSPRQIESVYTDFRTSYNVQLGAESPRNEDDLNSRLDIYRANGWETQEEKADRMAKTESWDRSIISAPRPPSITDGYFGG